MLPQKSSFPTRCLAGLCTWSALSTLLITLLVFTPAASAATCTVTTNAPNGSGSLREKIGDASCGTIVFDNNYTITLTDSTLTIARDVTINGSGHDIYVSGGLARRVFVVNSGTQVTLNGLKIQNGAAGADYGGGIYNAGTLTVTNTVLTYNSASRGGGIFNVGSLTLSGSQIRDCTAINGGDGGGIHNGGSGVCGTLDVTNSTFRDNSSQNDGGAIYNYSGCGLTLTNVTLTENSGAYGGGILNGYHSNAALTNVTFSGNSAGQGGGVRNDGGYLTVVNGIFWGDSGGEISALLFTPAITYSIVQGGYTGEGNLNADPMLAHLGGYGGSTPTFALLPNSPAINAGTNTKCPATDQRGVARPQGGVCDMGAFESSGFAFSGQSGTPQGTLINTLFATPLGLTVTALNPNEPVISGTVTFAGPLTGASTNPITVTATISTGGQVSQPVTANSQRGVYNVTASARGAATPLSYALSNLARLYFPLVMR